MKQTPDRREFLYYATSGMVVVGAGLAVKGLLTAIAPNRPAELSARVDLNDLPEGSQFMVKFGGNPILIHHRSPAEIALAREATPDQFRDLYARNANLTANAVAEDQNRCATTDGRFLVYNAACAKGDCVVFGQAGNFGGAFCTCCGSHYDTAGRIREGYARQNLTIPRLKVDADLILTLLPATDVPDVILDELIYGASTINSGA